MRKPLRRFIFQRRPRRLLLPIGLASAALMLGHGSALSFVLEEIGEWVVSCDNTATCSAVNRSQLSQLRVARPSSVGMSRLCIHRRPAADASVQLFVTLREHPSPNHTPRQGDRLLRIVGPTGPAPDIVMQHRGTDHWEVPQPHVETLLAGLTDDAQLQIVTRGGATLERLTVHGIERVLSVMDRAQARTVTTGALRGGGDAAPPVRAGHRQPPPLVTASLPKLTPTPAPSAATLRLWREACGEPGPDASTGYRLLGDDQRADRTLWVTPCNAQDGEARALFVIEREDGTAAPVAFPGSTPERPTGRPGMIAMPDFDPETGRVRELWRASPLALQDGTCLIQRLWGWNGRGFELAEEHRSLSCAAAATGYRARTFTRGLVTPAPAPSHATAQSFRPPC